jgi:hypothetical protein
MADKKKYKPLTPDEKRKKGYKEVGNVGGVPVFLPLSVTRYAEDIDDPKQRDSFLAKRTVKALEAARKAQEGSAAANGPVTFEVTENGRLLCKATGTRTWMIIRKDKGLEIFSKENVKLVREMLAKLPDGPPVVEAASDDDDEE